LNIDLAIAISTSGMCRTGFACSLANMIGRVVANGVSTLPEVQVSIDIDALESSCIHSNREHLVRRAIETGKTHLMFLDDDMSFDSGVLDTMLGRQRPVVVTNYLIKNDKMEFVSVGTDGKRVATTDESPPLESIAYSGFGVSLFDLKVFKSIPQPWFLPVWLPEEKIYTTEDNPFFMKVRKAGYKVYLDHDASKLISHLGVKTWNYQDNKIQCP